ncbi:hypothetical protein [Nocardia sp. NPDC050406]|uniref:hypothetical protein n=1 Tax=Nocardia sp. NPDC050406 TaxID=3364318 RepID=UPI0037B004E5
MPTSSPQQGHLWKTVSPLSGREARVIVVDGDLMARFRQQIIVAPLRESREVPTQYELLSIPLPGSTEIIALYDLTVAHRATFAEYLGTVPPEILERIRSGLSARFDL